MKLKFLGAAKTVTGSNFFLTGVNTGLMVDFGMFQGKPEEVGLNTIKPDIDFGALSAVLLTHAHLDHCGRLPLLAQYGFKGPIFMTEATKALAELVLYDAAKIAKEAEAKSVLYTDEDVEVILKQVSLVEYDKRFDVGDFTVTFLDAGHILGSASIIVEERTTGKSVAFSGDLGNTPEPLLSPTEFVTKANMAVVESTYGDEVHGPREEMEDLAKIINKAETNKGTVLIPSFSIERAQELLFIFDQLKKDGRMDVKTPVFLDSPMAIRATMIFKDFPILYSKKLKDQVKTDDPFDFSGLMICDTMEKSKQIKNYDGVKVIVAGSGMMSGGRVIHHAVNYLGESNTQLVMVGYQAEGTLGREILDGNRRINIWGNWITINAEVLEIKTMSAHADQGQVLLWLKKIDGLEEVALIHGEELPRLVLSEKIHQDLPDVKVVLPVVNQEIDLKL
ncbi:TPA: hypothetical protein DIU27_03230 [Candidatus Collierbacteria bacterium]|uniref:RNA-metabolising metallo-beta-lactamase n=1 Tax=Candidatus Collierbacteria bacterium GW2011_GWB2_44_22 TaxID=1618387 RepID=A0A0G1HXM8_9BACT|nr:MAG: hypothetical protein UW31_C0006G0091 [Candidatus Collierbacteria bacterium GW2011_GWA2_44_13]KKT48791.1 MAG: hypothetical protein UW42_C0047G0008 [Candidatus Collierbacteria bacterium GW2011_GWB1_44_197]KKT51373.1 MAG: hypothetical protein UW44_C0013G0093 [Candidatus Collierbacteria bacterium GW2011_GWB2_44_22]KKT61362.1 MAG: hypothetical protein UW56_C0027G0002 [Candidatus Collierbacteria bacterium GW2011_GWD1_44_27]KKT64482.1 MAG: hypothetical protein UW58_C0042G0003 [Candidatus Colli